MSKKYNLEPGYITVPEANKIVLNMLKIVNQNDKSHYNKILAGAKKGMYNGKKFGTRMYQVKKVDILQYAEECSRDEQLQLFNIELATDLDCIEPSKTTLIIDNKTAKQAFYYLRYLKFHEIISEDTFQKSEKNLILRTKMSTIIK